MSTTSGEIDLLDPNCLRQVAEDARKRVVTTTAQEKADLEILAMRKMAKDILARVPDVLSRPNFPGRPPSSILTHFGDGDFDHTGLGKWVPQNIDPSRLTWVMRIVFDTCQEAGLSPTIVFFSGIGDWGIEIK